MIGMLREGNGFVDYPYLDDAAIPVLDDIAWWAEALKTARDRPKAA